MEVPSVVDQGLDSSVSIIAEMETSTTPTGNRALVTEQATQNESDPALGVGRPEMTVPLHCLPVTDATVLEFCECVFTPWVKILGLREFKVCPGIVSAMFPQNHALKLSNGAVCGQAIMAAIDSVSALSVGTTGRIIKGTVYQHTHFLRPAINDDYHVRAEVLRFGKTSAFTETRVSFASTGKLVAHASLEFAF
ncbi:MAG TPA: PaaI family thioesterase [Candidatus Acidoferrales bacterium]|jgi:acyl-coenzyme A thioesterase PaaI-like protein|nr:PaaI family thioesterase [Candidatus Acidoferrales bacterium]